MYFFVHFVVLFVPGLVLCLGLRVARLSDAVSLGFLFSIIEITALLVLAKRLELTVLQTLVLWLAVLASIVGSVILASRRRAYQLRVNIAKSAPDLLCAASLVLATIAYLALVGPYLELPADVYAHLEYLQGATVDLTDNDFSRGFPLAVFSGPGNEIWYYLFAWVASLTNTNFQDAIFQATIANNVTLILVVYVFAGVVFAREGRAWRRRAMAVTATVIFFISFGTNIFAFVRYYALAPTILNLALYFATIAALLRYFEARGVPLFWLTLGVVAMAAAWLIHEQEAIFIFVVGLGVAIYAALRRWFRPDDNAYDTDAPGANVRGANAIGTNALGAGAHNAREQSRGPQPVSRSLTTGMAEWGVVPWPLLAALGLIALAALATWSHLSLPRYAVYDSKLISLQDFLPTARDLYVLNPARQFYETIALLGVVVYALCVLFVERIRAYPYVVVGFCVPLLTVFNPFFADLFLRHSRAESFWRFSFLVPIAFAAAIFLVSAWCRVRSEHGAARVVNVAVVLSIVAALFAPVHFGTFTTWTRWPTLQPIASDNSPEYWRDLIATVAALAPRTQLYTDPVTGYMLTGLTTAQSRRKKFHRYPVDELSLDYLNADRLRASDGAVLIVNRRDGTLSDNGRMSRHWPAEITKPSAYYRPELIEFIDANPNIFEPIWQADRVVMYRINGESV